MGRKAKAPDPNIVGERHKLYANVQTRPYADFVRWCADKRMGLEDAWEGIISWLIVQPRAFWSAVYFKDMEQVERDAYAVALRKLADDIQHSAGESRMERPASSGAILMTDESGETSLKRPSSRDR